MSYEEIELNEVAAVDQIQQMEEGTIEPPELPPRGSGHRRRTLHRDMERRLPSLNAPTSDPADMVPSAQAPSRPYFCNINEHYWARPANCEIAKIMCLVFVCIVLILAIAFVAYCVNGVDKLLPNRVNIKKGCFLITCVGDDSVVVPNPTE